MPTSTSPSRCSRQSSAETEGRGSRAGVLGQIARFVVFGLTAAGLIAISRVYVGVHYPTDVLAGAVLGALAGAAGAAVLRLPALHPREV